MERKTRDGHRRWRQWTEREARAALDELATSNESAVQFARRKGVSTQRLTYWRKRLAGTDLRGPGFVSVALPVASSTAARAQIEILAGGVTVRVREDLEAERLAHIIEVLAGRIATC